MMTIRKQRIISWASLSRLRPLALFLRKTESGSFVFLFVANSNRILMFQLFSQFIFNLSEMSEHVTPD